MEKMEIKVELTFITAQPLQAFHFPVIGAKGAISLDFLKGMAGMVCDTGGSVVVSDVRKYIADAPEELYGWNYYDPERAEIEVPHTALGLASPLLHVMIEDGTVYAAYKDNMHRWRATTGRELAEKVIYWKKISGIIYDEPQKRYEKIAAENAEKGGDKE